MKPNDQTDDAWLSNLEQLPQPVVHVWRQTHKWIIIAGLLVGFLGLLLWHFALPSGAHSVDTAINRAGNGANSQGQRIENTVNLAQNGIGFFALLALSVGAVLLGPVCSAAACVRLLIGPPKAASSPKKSVQTFYSKAWYSEEASLDNLFTENMGRLSAYMCLSGEARRDMREWNDFCRHWTDARVTLYTEIDKLVKETSKTRGHDYNDLMNTSVHCSKALRVEELDVKQITDTEAVFELAVNCSIRFMKESGRSVVINTHSYSVSGQVQRVGHRWYITNGKWTGVLKTTEPGAVAATA